MKKTLFLTLLLSLSIAAAHLAVDAQSELKVIDHECRLSSRPYAVNPNLNTDPFGPGMAAIQLQRDRAETVRANEEYNKKLGIPLQPIPTAAGRPVEDPQRYATRAVYSYQAHVRNDSTKRISSVVWEYVFVDASNNADIRRHRFTSRVRIRPGSSGILRGKGTLSPVAVIHAGANAGTFDERVEIIEVAYADGTAWQKGSK